MKHLLKLEEATLLALSIYLFSLLDVVWWAYPALFFAPDLSMLGYIVGPQVGAVTYNTLHHKATAVVLYLLGTTLGIVPLQVVAVILLGHASFDRILGYGLKRTTAFHDTHLGTIGREPA